MTSQTVYKLFGLSDLPHSTLAAVRFLLISSIFWVRFSLIEISIFFADLEDRSTESLQSHQR
jgi:hypothetical protein